MNTGISHDFVTLCKWCSQRQATQVFENENAPLCDSCFKNVSLGAQHPKICSACQQLFTSKLVTSDLLSKNGLNYAGLSGREYSCGLCRMIVLQDPNIDPNRGVGGLTLFAGAARVELPDWERGFASHDDVDALFFSTEPGQYSLTLSVSAYDGNPASKFVSQRPLGDRLDDLVINKETQIWLKECLETHEGCNGLNSKPFMPTRVIEIGDSGDSVKLAHPLSKEGQYVAMSYCWGRAPFLTTKNSNFEQHQKEIKVSDMPQTFQDAIITTKNLGFKYVWIDALCIIQDSSEDKAKEISVMGDIYTHATITIVSVSGTCVADGFLRTKLPPKVQLPYQCPTGEMGQVEVSPQVTVNLWKESAYTRGWCLQENLLSKCLLLYTGMEVVWQCQSTPMRRRDTTHVNYTGDNPSFEVSRDSPFRRLPNSALNTNLDLNLEVSDADRYHIWTDIVASYTRRKLTVATDRLPALDGIVQVFKTAWKDEYYYGIWKGQFIPSLCWSRSDQIDLQEQFARLDAYRAPSWSWASIDGPVLFKFEYEIRSPKIQGAVFVELVEQMIQSHGRMYLVLNIEAPIIPVKEFLRSKLAGKGHIGFLTLDDHSVTTEMNRWPRYADKFDHFDEESLEIIHLILLREGLDGGGKMRSIMALVVIEDSAERGAFSRIGMFTSSVKGISKAWGGTNKRRVIRMI